MNPGKPVMDRPLQPPLPQATRGGEPAGAVAASASTAAEVPLVVDLDGTLLRTDSLYEGLLTLARRRPLSLLGLPHWAWQGRARVKQAVAERTDIDLPTLPVNMELLAELRAQRRQGRRLVLATGADETIARAVADDLDLFDSVLASDGRHNLSGGAKRDRLVAAFGRHGFDYVGNGRDDLPVWAAARRAWLVSPAPGLAERARAVAAVERVFPRDPARLALWLGAMRVQHWLKNLLLLVPLLAAHRLHDAAILAHTLVGVACFSLAASAIYLLNDLLDLGADRRHPHKRRRALASGQLPIASALALVPLLCVAAAGLSLWLAPALAPALGAYTALMVVYSLGLKDLALVDAFALALGYTLRIGAGALASGVQVSPWLLVCSTALFFGLALLKRYAELVSRRGHDGRALRVRAYRSGDAAPIAGLGITSGVVAVALLALYPIVEPSGYARWPVWCVCGLLLYWTGAMWLTAHRGGIHDDPVSFALRDPLSRVFGLLTLALLMLTT